MKVDVWIPEHIMPGGQRDWRMKKSDTKMRHRIIAIVGQPNSGKTTIFQFLTKQTAQTGNWDGVAVSPNHSKIQHYNTVTGTIVDLPGIRSFTHHAITTQSCNDDTKTKQELHPCSICIHKHNCHNTYVKDNCRSKGGDVNDGNIGINENTDIIDLFQKDESETITFLFSHKVDIVVNVIDATRLQRDLQLTIQLLEMGFHVFIIVNKIDITRKNGITINTKLLEQKLCCCVIAANAKNYNDLRNIYCILQNIINFGEKKYSSHRCTQCPKYTTCIHHSSISNSRIKPTLALYPHHIAKSNRQIIKISNGETSLWKVLLHHRYHSMHFFSSNKNISISGILNIQKQPYNSLQQYEEIITSLLIPKHKNNTNNLDDDKRQKYTIQSIIHSFSSATIKYATELYAISTSFTNTTNKTSTLSKMLDKVVLHKLCAIPIFACIFLVIFFTTVSTGSFLQYTLDSLLQFCFKNYIRPYLYTALLYVTSNCESVMSIIDGVAMGTKTLISFLPIMWILYFLLTTLEDSGYVARTTYILGPLLRKIGLSSHSIIPLTLGLGCSVPGILATRSIKTKKQRLITTMIVTLLPCSAKLAVFSVFCSTLFTHNRIWITMLLYCCSCILVIGIGKTLSHYIYQMPDTKILIQEHAGQTANNLPNYNAIDLAHAFRVSTLKTREFIRSIWQALLIVSIIMNLLNTVNVAKNQSTDSSNITVLNAFAIKVTPYLQNIGIEQDNWQAAVGLVTGIFAKESIISTLSSLYSAEHYIPDYLRIGIKKHTGWYSVAHVKFVNDSNMIAYLLFVLFYFPCITTFFTIKNEFGYRYAIFTAIFNTCCAYTCSAIFHTLSVLTNTHEFCFLMVVNTVAAVLLLLIVLTVVFRSINILGIEQQKFFSS